MPLPQASVFPAAKRGKLYLHQEGTWHRGKRQEIWIQVKQTSNAAEYDLYLYNECSNSSLGGLLLGPNEILFLRVAQLKQHLLWMMSSSLLFLISFWNHPPATLPSAQRTQVM